LLKPVDRIPSARALTKELGLARGTIEAAYSLLAAEGYIQARGQGRDHRDAPASSREHPIASANAQVRQRHCCGWVFVQIRFVPFQMGLPALDAFPRKDLGALGRAMCGATQPSDMAHPSIYGLPACVPRLPQ
jgi:GntR family transcriptional regulator/MocR family aminotransferase